MIKLWNWVKNNPNRAMFLVPILLVAGISISHVVTWYDMANPINWAIYLSIAIEVGAITALVAATNRIKGGIWFMFGIVTFIQMIGNIFYSYKEIDANGELFKSWVELTGPIWELLGTEITDVVGMKRWLAFLEGGLLPVISLTSLHFFVKYEDPNSPKEEEISSKETINEEKIDIIEEINSPKEEGISPKTDLQKEADRVWETVKKLKEEGVFPEPTEEEMMDEPTSLANSGYRERAELEEYEEDEDYPKPNEKLIKAKEIWEGVENPQYREEHEPIEEENPEDETSEPIEIKNKGEELSQVWQNILRKRKEERNKLGE